MKSLNYAATGSMLLAVMALIAAPQAGADDCKYYMESVNAETGEAIRWTRQKTLRLLQNTDHHGGYFMFLQEGDSRYLVLDVWSPYRYDEDRPTKDVFDNWASISVGDKLLLLMADESIIELQASQDSQADVRMVPPQTLYNREPKPSTRCKLTGRLDTKSALPTPQPSRHRCFPTCAWKRLEAMSTSPPVESRPTTCRRLLPASCELSFWLLNCASKSTAARPSGGLP